MTMTALYQVPMSSWYTSVRRRMIAAAVPGTAMRIGVTEPSGIVTAIEMPARSPAAVT
jgi:hypothetical protein